MLAPPGGEAEAAHGRGEVTMFGLRENLPNVQAFVALVIALAVLTWPYGPAQADISFHRIDDGRAIAYPDLRDVPSSMGGGMSLGLPRGAPLSAHIAILAISSRLSDGSIWKC